jgi:ribonucleoside-diphosphate reductase alpha chain
MSPVIEMIKKRNGQIAPFDKSKIVVAVKKSFEAVSDDPHTMEAESVADQVARLLERTRIPDVAPSVETVQDIVERALMERGFFDVAKAYIIYRYEHTKIREQKTEELKHKIEGKELLVTKRSGASEPFDVDKVAQTVRYAMRGYEDVVNVHAVVEQVWREMYDGIETKSVRDVTIMVVRSFIERDPAYSKVAARLLLASLYDDVLGHGFDWADLDGVYRRAFVSGIKEQVALKQLDPRLLELDLDKLAGAMDIERDDYFKYLGLQTLHTNYFMKDPDTKRRLETPQAFWMRVAMGVALVEKTKEEREKWAIEFYRIISEFYYTPSSPTLYHSGWTRPQLSSCFLNTVPDDLHLIFKSYSDNAQLLKYAGGTATDWTPVRATGAFIKSIGVESQGTIPFIKIANDVTVSINRSGRRRGAGVVYMETWHYDFEDFLELRKNTGDERRRAHDLNTASWIPDLFMKRIEADADWTLLSPHEAPELHDLYGRAFDEKYAEYEAKAARGEMKLWKKVKAKDLWRKMLTQLFETGHPWVTFKDACNIRSPQDHVGVVHSSNLCTEITLNTSADETAVCNLGSLNYAKLVKNGAFDRELVAEVVPIAMRMLDNVIDINFYPTEDTKRSNMRHRPVGLGVRGIQDALYQLSINFDSEAAIAFADESMEIVSYYAILSSSMLARERGAYETYIGSKWDRGALPQDTVDLLEQERGIPVETPRNERLDWAKVRTHIKEYGMRNSNTMAIAPTATIANIVGCYPTTEPIYQNLYVKSNMAGDFVVVNEYLVDDLKARGLWDKTMLDQLKYHEGSVQPIEDVPQELKEKYKTVFEIDPTWIVRAAAHRGRWIDQSQSTNIFFRGTSGKDLSEVYFYAWRLGLKTTYYLRTVGASRVEQSTISLSQFTKEGGGGRDAIRRNATEEIEAMHKPEMAQISTLEQVSPISAPQAIGGVSATAMSKITVAATMSPDHPEYCESCQG